MSLQYTPLYDENGDVIDPAFWVQGAATFAGVINGGLDRDNLPANTIVAAEVTSNAFTFIEAFNTDDSFAPDMENTGWQNGTGTTTGTNNLGILEWTAEQDAHYDIYWSGTWAWNGSYSWVEVGARLNQTDTFDTVMLRITVDGVPICTAGPFEDGMDYGSTYMCGSIQLPAGQHTLKVECKVVRLIAQSGQESGQCTNAVEFDSRSVLAIGRMR